MDDGLMVPLALIGVIIGMLFSGWIYDWGGKSSIEELGQSICEEEYGMDFDKYSYRETKLYCKPIVPEKEYDGIVVSLKNK